MINLEIEIDDQATPVINALLADLKDPTEFHRLLALDLAEYTQHHIREAARTRHETAGRLGSAPTGYLSKAADTVEQSSDSGGVTLRVAGAIFKRVNGPVTVRPREKKYLTIPVHADAVGKKAQELWWRKEPPKKPRKGKRARLIQGLVFIKSKKGNLLLARPMADGSIVPYYLLKTSVTLQVAEKAARWYLNRRLRRAGL